MIKCANTRNGKHRYRPSRFLKSDPRIEFRACRFCDHIEYSLFDRLKMRRTVIEVEQVEETGKLFMERQKSHRDLADPKMAEWVKPK